MTSLRAFFLRKSSVDIAIIDNLSPHPLSGFRYQEFHSLISKIPKTVLLTNGTGVHLLGKESIEELIDSYIKKYPQHRSLVKRINGTELIDAKLLYCIFLENAFLFVVDLAERNSIPFVFTLYPGGGFALNNQESDKKLRRVMESPYFKKVIVTQRVTYDYLIKKGFCSADKIEYIFGVVMPLEKLELSVANKKRYGRDKKVLDICFVAHRYTARGEDKGYDVFIDVAKQLSAKYNNIAFHVVGQFDDSVIDTKGIKHIQFHGVHSQDWFDNFYLGIDIILSPNINNKLDIGAFDGFPTAAVTDAALRGVAMFSTDPLNLGAGLYEHGKTIEIIPHNAEKITAIISKYVDHPHKLISLSENGYELVNKLYDYHHQIEPRIDILLKALKN